MADNVSYNRGALSQLSQKYPKLFMFGCVAHTFDLAYEDLAKIKEFSKLVQDAKIIVNFVRNHKHIKNVFKARICAKGKMLVNYPETRFAYADLMIIRVIKNKQNLRDMVDARDWKNISAGIDRSLVDNFKLVDQDNFFRKLDIMHEVLGPMSKIIHHLESCGARASWVFPLATSYAMHVMEWQNESSTARFFGEGVMKKVLETFGARWEGTGQLQVGLKNTAHTLAYMTDPFTIPTLEQAPDGWQAECAEALQQFYT